MTKNTLAREQLSSEEGKTSGQSDRNESASLFWFPVYEGLFEHAPIISDAVWLFMWLIARTTREKNGSGSVLGGVPIHDGRPAGELGFPIKTIRRWRRMLVGGGYIAALRTPFGFRYTLLKSKKWQKQILSECPKLPITGGVIGQIGHSDLPLRAVRVPETGITKKTVQRQHREEAEDATTATNPPLKGKNRQVLIEAWDAVGIEPCGSLKFTSGWERIYGDRPENEPLSATMERCIQHCQENGIRVPPPFFLAKRGVEQKESEDDSEVRRVKVLPSVEEQIAELERLGLMR